MRKQIGRRWLTHKVVRNTPVEGPLEYEHIVPVLVFALRREIHRETFTTDDCFGCLVTRQEHQTLLKLRSNPTILIASLACERDELLDVCLRRYSAVGLRLVKLSERVVAPRSGPIVLPS